MKPIDTKQTLIRYTAGCLFNVHFVPIACTNSKQWLQSQPSLHLLWYWTDLLSYKRQDAVEVQVLSNNRNRKKSGHTKSNQWNLPLLISQVGKNKPNLLCFMSDAQIHLYAHMDTAIYVCLYGHMNGKRGREKGGMQVTVYIILLILLYFSVSLFIASFFSLLILSWYPYSNNMLPL